MKRKVVKQGKTALTVTLPSKWAKKYGLQPGEEIDIEERGKDLIISKQGVSETKKISIDVSNMHEIAIKKIASTLHKYGYDEIELIHNNPKINDVIRKLINDLFIGFTIIEQNENKCVIKSISKDIGSEFDATLRRAFLITISIGEDSLEMIKEGKLMNLRELVSLERVNNQLTNFCERILNKEGYKKYGKTCFMYILVWSIEKICDNYKYICDFLYKNNKIKMSPEVIELYQKTNNFLKSSYELFYKFDMDKLIELTLEKEKILSGITDLYKKSTDKEIFVINCLVDSITRTTNFFTSVIISHIID